MEFHQTLLECLLDGPLSKVFKYDNLIQKYGYHANQKKTNFEKSSCQELLAGYENSLARMVTGEPLPKLLKVLIWWSLYFLLHLLGTLQMFLSNTTIDWLLKTNFYQCVIS